jgi:hypothetical protein
MCSSGIQLFMRGSKAFRLLSIFFTPILFKHIAEGESSKRTAVKRRKSDQCPRNPRPSWKFKNCECVQATITGKGIFQDPVMRASQEMIG